MKTKQNPILVAFRDTADKSNAPLPELTANELAVVLTSLMAQNQMEDALQTIHRELNKPGVRTPEQILAVLTQHVTVRIFQRLPKES
jgi:hypothetical protein